MSSVKRIAWVDVAKFICIVCVMFQHWGSGYSEGLLRPDFLASLYIHFFLEGFCFVSGYVYKYVFGFKKHLIKKVKQLLIPAILFSTAQNILSYIWTTRPNQHNSFIKEWIGNFIQIRSVYGGMWFVFALFNAYLIFYFLIKRFENNNSSRKNIIIICIIMYVISMVYQLFMPSSVFSWGTNALPFHLDYLPTAILFMVAGYMYRNYYEEKIYINNSIKIIFVCIYFLLVLFVNSNNMLFLLVLNIFRNIFGVVFLIIVSKAIKTNRFISFVGQNTLNYFGMHGKTQSILRSFVIHIFKDDYYCLFDNGALAFASSILFTTLVCLLLIPLSICINKYFPFMVGKSYKKTNIS